MHDPRAHEPLPHGGGDATGAPDLVDGPHVERMAAFDALPRARHAERRPENRRLEIVHRDGVPAEERLHVAVLDEPDHVFARSRVYQGGPHHPDDLPAALLLLTQELRQDRVVHGPLPRHLRLHEAELVGAVTAAEKALGVHEDALAAILFRADRDGLPFTHLARLGRHQITGGLTHDDAIHARQTRAGPRPRSLDVCRQVGGRKEPVGQDSVGGRGLEARIGRSLERGRLEVGWPVLEPGTGGHRNADNTRGESRHATACVARAFRQAR